MWLRLRNTARRGRAAVPCRWRRIRSWRFCRAEPRLRSCVIVFVPSLSLSLLAADLAGLAGLAADSLARVADTLALVRLGLASRTHPRGHLSNELLVDPDDSKPDWVFELEANPRRRFDLDGMAVAQVELELVADLRRAIADAGDLEDLPVAIRHALDHVGDERPGKAMELAVHLEVRGTRDHEVPVL